MTAASLAGAVMVAFAGLMLAVGPAVAKPTLPLGVRIPPAHAQDPAVAAVRRAYTARAAVAGVAFSALAFTLGGLLPGGPWWMLRLVLLAELAADLAFLRLGRREIIAVKQAGRWFAGRRQVVIADTGWRADPPRFPVRWLVPALAVIAVTVTLAALRYPALPARLATVSGRLEPKSPAIAVGVVAAQGYVTALWSGLLLLIYRARPDLDAADPAASAARYRAFLARAGKAMLALVAGIDLTLLIAGLRSWQLLPVPRAASAVLMVAPFAAGLAALAVVLARSGQGGFRLAPGDAGAGASLADRDDDRFWKAGLLYLNRDDPAVVVPARIGPGWTLNFGNRGAWLLIAIMVAVPAGLAAILIAVGR